MDHRESVPDPEAPEDLPPSRRAQAAEREVDALRRDAGQLLEAAGWVSLAHAEDCPGNHLRDGDGEGKVTNRYGPRVTGPIDDDDEAPAPNARQSKRGNADPQDGGACLPVVTLHRNARGYGTEAALIEAARETFPSRPPDDLARVGLRILSRLEQDDERRRRGRQEGKKDEGPAWVERRGTGRPGGEYRDLELDRYVFDLRRRFVDAINEKVPQVFDLLHRTVYPIYVKAREATKPDVRWKLRRFEAGEWDAPVVDAVPVLVELREALFRWARTFRGCTAPWMIDVGLRTLGNIDHGRPPPRFSRRDDDGADRISGPEDREDFDSRFRRLADPRFVGVVAGPGFELEMPGTQVRPEDEDIQQRVRRVRRGDLTEEERAAMRKLPSHVSSVGPGGGSLQVFRHPPYFPRLQRAEDYRAEVSRAYRMEQESRGGEWAPGERRAFRQALWAYTAEREAEVSAHAEFQGAAGSTFTELSFRRLAQTIAGKSPGVLGKEEGKTGQAIRDSNRRLAERMGLDW